MPGDRAHAGSGRRGVSLGIGIDVNTAIFTRLQYMVFQPLPRVVNAGALQLVEPRTDAGGYPGVSWLEYRDLREQTSSFTDLLAARMVPFNVGEASRVERTFGQLVSANYFSVLGLQPAFGRFLRPEETDQIGRESVAVISYDLWQSRFGGAATVIGQTIRVNRHDLTIVGVAPEGFQGSHLGLQFDLWVPATLAQLLLAGSRELEDRSQRGYVVMGHLRNGATTEQTQEELDRVMQELARVYPETNSTMRAEVVSFWRSPRGPQRMFVGALGILQGIMLIVLITICGNTATLMLTRASERQREMGVRLAIGAGRGRLVRAVLTETIVLALMGPRSGPSLRFGPPRRCERSTCRATCRSGSKHASIQSALRSPACSVCCAGSSSAPRRRSTWHASIRCVRFVRAPSWPDPVVCAAR